jgi:hypothetical protein
VRKHALITYRLGAGHFRLTSEDVVTEGEPGTAMVTGCSDAVFLPFGAQASLDNSTE